MIGTTLDKYEVLQKVGEGGMATVYRGRHSTLDRDVAIKVLHPHLSSSARNRLRFAREAKAVERLRHDNILEIFDYSGSQADDCYIVTEFVDGETLTHLLHRTGRMPSEMVAIVGIEVARALGYAHREGILHRDLKTDNVMVRVDGAVKLMDFGIARFLDESQVTMTGALVGSPAFMSPEQAREDVLDARSDLFSLGTVLFYLVTGHLPFSGSNPSLILKNVIEGNRPHVAELAPTMSASLSDVIEQLLAINPDDRFVSAGDVERALGECLAETHVDPSDAGWSIGSFVHDPVIWTERLDAHLTRVLADEGRRRLAEGDHLAALRLFNRLLSMDEDNEEVLALVQNLHGSPSASSSRSLRWVPLLLLALGFTVALWRFAMAPDPPRTGSVAPPEAAAALPPLAEPAKVFVEEPELPRVVEGPGELAEDESATAWEAAPDTVDPPVEVVRPATVAKATGTPTRRVTVRSEPEPELEPEEEVAPRFGTLLVNADRLVGEVFIGDRMVGRTREAITLAEGTYDVTIRSKFTIDHLEEGVRVEPDEKNLIDVTLQLKPRRVFFIDWPGDCRLEVDGVDRGRLGGLDHHWRVTRPDTPLDVEVTCPGGRPAYERRFDYLVEDVRVTVPDLGDGSRGRD